MKNEFLNNSLLNIQLLLKYIQPYLKPAAHSSRRKLFYRVLIEWIGFRVYHSYGFEGKNFETQKFDDSHSEGFPSSCRERRIFFNFCFTNGIVEQKSEFSWDPSTIIPFLFGWHFSNICPTKLFHIIEELKT